MRSHEVLEEHHLQMLTKESAMSPEVIAAREYRTVRHPSELEAYGFNKSQRRAPGLLLPVHPTDGGDPPLYVYRPDSPRVNTNQAGDRKVLKYEIPAGAAMRLDFPPPCKPTLRDPSVPLWITEGQKKSDALTSQGPCTIAPSVSAYRSNREGSWQRMARLVGCFYASRGSLLNSEDRHAVVKLTLQCGAVSVRRSVLKEAS